MLGRTLKPPALMRRAYCGSRVTPCPSDPCRSASAINVATVTASLSGRPSLVSASVMNAFRRSKLTVNSGCRVDTPVLKDGTPGRGRLAALKQRPQAANVGDGFDGEHGLDQLVRLFTSQDRRGEIAALVNPLAARHRIARRAAHG